MADLKISALPLYTGDTTGFYTVVDDSTQDTTYTTLVNPPVGVVPNSGIVYSGDTSKLETLYNTTLDDSLATPTTLGGIPAGTTVLELKTQSLVKIIDDILFPTLQPTYTPPIILLTSDTSGIEEVGKTVNPFLTLSGTKNDAGWFSYLKISKTGTSISSTSSPMMIPASDISAQFGYTDPNNPNILFDLSFTDSGVVVPPQVSSSPSNIYYQGVGNYNSGSPKKNNKGNTDIRMSDIRNNNAPQSGDSNFPSNQINIYGYYPYFYGVLNGSSRPTESTIISMINGGSAGYTTVVGDGSGSISMAFNAVGQWGWFALFGSYSHKTHWSETVFNSGTIGNSDDLFPAPSTGNLISSYHGYWSGIPYTIYISKSTASYGTLTIS